MTEFTIARVDDIPKMLRHLADSIEEGDLSNVDGLAWVAIHKDSKITAGYCGQAADPLCAANVILDLGKDKIKEIFLEDWAEE